MWSYKLNIFINAHYRNGFDLGLHIKLDTKRTQIDTDWSFVKDLCIHSPMTLPRKICPNLQAEIPPSLQISSNLPLRIYWNLQAEIPPPLVCRFPQICHYRFTKICRQNPPPRLQISSNLPLQIYWNLQAEIPPPRLQISSNLPLRIYWNLQAEIPPPLVCRFPQICHYRFTKICRQNPPQDLQISSNLPLQIYWNLQAEIPPPPFADFLKSTTADLL